MTGILNQESAGIRGSLIEVYVSHPFPHRKEQSDFLDSLRSALAERGLAPCTTSALEDPKASLLSSIRSRIVSSHGLIVVAFRKTWVHQGTIRKDSEIAALPSVEISGSWLTSPYCQIEPAMAYAHSLPIMALLERGVLPEGILTHASDVFRTPEIDLGGSLHDYFHSEEWVQKFSEWEFHVRRKSGDSESRHRGDSDSAPSPDVPQIATAVRPCRSKRDMFSYSATPHGPMKTLLG
jgi:hypothetical protein